MNSELRVSIEITNADRALFLRHVRRKLRRTTTQARDRRHWLVAAGTLAFLGTMWLFDRWRGSLGYPTTWLAAFLVGGGLLTLLLILGWADSRSRRDAIDVDFALRSPKRIDYVFDQEGVRFRASDREGLVRWTAVSALDETETHVFVMLDLTNGWIFPKRQLVPDEITALCATVRARLGEAPLARMVPPEGLEPSTR